LNSNPLCCSRKNYDARREDGGSGVEKIQSLRTFGKNSCNLLAAITHTKILIAYFIISDYLVVEQKFWTFKIPWGNTDIILLTRVVELSKAPVNQPQLQQTTTLSYRLTTSTDQRLLNIYLWLQNSHFSIPHKQSQCIWAAGQLLLQTRSPAIAEGPRDAGVPVEIW